MNGLTIKILKVMKRNILLSYSAPELDIFEVAVEGGYGESTSLPGFNAPGFGWETGDWDE